MFRFKPAIGRDGSLFEFPRPVPQIKITDTWDAERVKIPFRGGDLTAGHSPNGVDISIRGQVGSHHGALKLSEEAMFLTLEQLRSALNVDSDGGKFDLYLFHDAATNTCRRFRQCTTTRFEFDLSDEALYSYSASIHAEDPVLYATLPE